MNLLTHQGYQLTCHTHPSVAPLILPSLAGLLLLSSQAALLEEEVSLLVGLLSGSQDLSQLLRWAATVSSMFTC
jgi:hypothetical protein